MDITQVAKEIRAILKTNFPAVKFSIKSSRFSQGSSVDTSWTDGPTTDQVDELIGHYGNSRTRFIGTSRKHGQELVEQAIAAWRKQYPEYAHFTVACKGDTSWGFRAEFDMSEFNCGRHRLEDCERSLNALIYSSAFDGTNLILSQENADDCKLETVSASEPEVVEIVAEVTPETQLPMSHANPSEVDVLEAELEIKRKEAQSFHVKTMNLFDQIEAAKCKTEITAIPQAQPDFDVKALETQKVTLVLVNGMGVPVCRHVTIISADIVPAKRYQGDMTSKMCLQLQYVEKGKRKLKGTRYTEADLAVALGWQQIKVPNNFVSFDTALFDGMIRQAKDVVYFQQAGQASTGAMIDRLCVS